MIIEFYIVSLSGSDKTAFPPNAYGAMDPGVVSFSAIK